MIDDLDVLGLINFDNGSELELYINCFNESLRMQPPVYISSSCCMSEDVWCGPIKMRKDDPFSISIYHLHNNPEEWFEKCVKILVLFGIPAIAAANTVTLYLLGSRPGEGANVFLGP